MVSTAQATRMVELRQTVASCLPKRANKVEQRPEGNRGASLDDSEEAADRNWAGSYVTIRPPQRASIMGKPQQRCFGEAVPGAVAAQPLRSGVACNRRRLP
jgi:hypothetical protein